MPAQQEPQTIEDPEARDGQELAEQQLQTIGNIVGGGWPMGSNGKPMALIVGGISDKVPTVQYGNVVLGPIQIYRFIEDEGMQARIDAGREAMREVEFICGVERRLLQWAVDPSMKVASPVTGQDAFAAPPAGYDPSAAPAHPGDALVSQPAEVAPTTVAPEGAQGAQVG